MRRRTSMTSMTSAGVLITSYLTQVCKLGEIEFHAHGIDAHFYDVRMVYHLKILDFAGDSCLRFGILGIDSCFADALQGDSLAGQHVYSHCRMRQVIIDGKAEPKWQRTFNLATVAQ